MRIALTGHRPERLHGKEMQVETWIREYLTVNDMIDIVEEVYCGMATGADQIFGRECINLDIPVVCCYPFPKKYYHPKELEIKDKAKDVIFINQNYSKQSYFIRDKYMVDNCDVLLAIWDGIKAGGTWLTIEYARKVGKPIIYYMIGDKENG